MATTPSEGGNIPVGVQLVLGAIPLVIGIFFLFDRPTDMGFTFDELTDFEIATDLLNTGNVLGNLKDPSQGRLSHMVAAGGMWLLGSDLLGFKLTFLGIGLAATVLCAVLVRSLFGSTVAWLSASFLILCPFSLAAFRTAATAGDGLVLIWWLLFTWITACWIARQGGWAWSVAVGVVLGLAIGTKLTSAALILVPLVRLFYMNRSSGSPQAARALSEFLVIYLVAGCTAVLANPLFLLGPRFFYELLGSGKWDTKPEIWVFDGWYRHPPLTYIPAVLMSKLTPPLFLAALVGLAIAVRDALAKRARLSPVAAVGVAVITAALVHYYRQNQNAHYYVGTIGPALILGGFLWQKILGSEAARARRAGYALAAMVMIYLVATDRYLQADFLQSGREYGPAFQGEFNGPAVNHCQGGPRLIDYLKALPDAGSIRVVFIYAECQEQIEAACRFGSTPCATTFKYYPEEGVMTSHVVAASRIVLRSRIQRAEWDRRFAALRSFAAHCQTVPLPSDEFTLYRCPGGPALQPPTTGLR